MQIIKENFTTSRPSNNIPEIFDDSFPDLLSLYGVAAITRESSLLMQVSNYSSHDICFSIDGFAEGYVYIKPCLNFSKDFIKESANIILGHLLTAIDNKNLNCSLGVYKTINDEKSDYQFCVKYMIDDMTKQDEISLNFCLNRKEY